jgi:transcription elongation factor GreA
MANNLTQHGKIELENKLKELLAERDKIVARVVDARTQGDLSENAEYDNARDEQEKNQTAIDEIKAILADVNIISEDADKSDVITLGSVVKLSNDSVYRVVGSIEAAPLDGKISDESPLGQALIGKKVGEKVEYDVGDKKNVVTIVSVK